MKKASEDAFILQIKRCAGLKRLPDDNEEDGDEEDCQQCRGQHASHYACTNRILCPA